MPEGRDRQMSQLLNQLHRYLFTLLPCSIVGDNIVSATGDSGTKLDGVRCFELVLCPQPNNMVCNSNVEREKADVF